MRVSRWVTLSANLLLISSARAAQVAAAKPATVSGSHHRVNPCHQVELGGTVTAGGSFRKAFAPGLDFVLEAVPKGWVIRVLPSAGTKPEQDFAEVATPPFRSINPLLLTTDFGFRSQDVVGWNPRSFRFVTNASEFSEAQRAYRAATSSSHATPEQETAVTRVAMRAMEGRLELLDAVLAPGSADQTSAAGLVASHLDSTAHTFRSPESGAAGALGEVLSLRFRVALSDPRQGSCDGAIKPARKD